MDGTSATVQQAYAAWVQAVGSIVAIFSGVLLLRYQANLQRRNRLKAVRAIVDMSIELVTRRITMPEDFGEAFDFFISLNAEEIRFAYGALCDIPLHEIDSAHGVRQVGIAIESMRRILAKLESERVRDMSHMTQYAVVANAFKEDVERLKDVSLALSRLK